ncbi:MAG: hypothetical protein ACRD6Q_06880 [Nitrososphaeraceae archaeon]
MNSELPRRIIYSILVTVAAITLFTPVFTRSSYNSFDMAYEHTSNLVNGNGKDACQYSPK